MTQRQKYDSYMKGWRDGAARRSMSIELFTEQLPHYEKGYTDGQKAGHAAGESAAIEYCVQIHNIVAQ